MSESKFGVKRKSKINLEHLIVRQSKKVQKSNNNDGEFQKDTPDKLEGSPTAKNETI